MTHLNVFEPELVDRVLTLYSLCKSCSSSRASDFYSEFQKQLSDLKNSYNSQTLNFSRLGLIDPLTYIFNSQPEDIYNFLVIGKGSSSRHLIEKLVGKENIIDVPLDEISEETFKQFGPCLCSNFHVFSEFMDSNKIFYDHEKHVALEKQKVQKSVPSFNGYGRENVSARLVWSSHSMLAVGLYDYFGKRVLKFQNWWANKQLIFTSKNYVNQGFLDSTTPIFTFVIKHPRFYELNYDIRIDSIIDSFEAADFDPQIFEDSS